MAAELNARHNKQLTIAFTLPISCQVCLGKVKSPVLCPNNHVFCSTCLDVWLQKNKHCPACRASMTSPKKIMGGVNHQENESDKLTNPDLRKARFDLLYKEYENEFERMQSEIHLLKTENQILKQQSRKDGFSDNRPSHGESVKSSEQLLVLTRKLQDATKLYEKIKGELTQVKQENANLKDENVSLNRENQNLRQEIAGRSPHRYGRITVQTLESKLASAEKDVTRLTKALERSDEYIEKLEKEREDPQGRSSMASSHGDKYSMNGDALTRKSVSESKVSNPNDYGVRGDNASRRQLFSDDKGGKSSSGERSKYYYDRNGDNRGGDLRNDSMRFENDKRSGKSQSAKSEVSNGNKRVTFDLSKNTDTTAVSFELEKPSPIKMPNGRNSGSTRSASPVKGVLKKGGDKQNGGKSSKNYDGYTSDLSKTLEEDSLSGSYNPKAADVYSKDDDLLYRRSKSVHGDRKFDNSDNAYSSNRKKYSADDSVLSQPSDVERKSLDEYDYLSKRSGKDSDHRNDDLDYGGGRTQSSRSKGRHSDLDRSDLDDTNYIESELDELNISLTPEFTDCMKLLNRAEKKVQGGSDLNFDDTPPSYKSKQSDSDAAFRASTGSIGYKVGSSDDFLSNYKPESDRFASSVDSYSRGRHVRTGSLDNIYLSTERSTDASGDLNYRPSSALPSTTNMYPPTAQSKYSAGLTTGRTTLSRTPSVDNLLMSRQPSAGYQSKYSSLGNPGGFTSRAGLVPNYSSYNNYSENSDKVDVNGTGGNGGTKPFPASHDIMSTGGGLGLDRDAREDRVSFDAVLQARARSLTDHGKDSGDRENIAGLQSGRLTPTLPSTGAGSEFDSKYTTARELASEYTSRNGLGSGRSTPTLTSSSDYKSNAQFSDYKYMGSDLSLKPPTGSRASDMVPIPSASSRMSNSTNLTNYTNPAPSYSNPAPSYTNTFSSAASSNTDPSQGYLSGMTNYSLGGSSASSGGGTNSTGGVGGGMFYDGTKYEGKPFSLSSNSKSSLSTDNYERMNGKSDYLASTSSNRPSGFDDNKYMSSANSGSGSSSSNGVPAYTDYNYRDGTDFSNFSSKVGASSLPLPVASSSTVNPSSGSFAGSTYGLGSSSSASSYTSSSYLPTSSSSSVTSYSTAHSVPFTYTSSLYTASGPSNSYASSKPLDPIVESTNQFSYVSNASGDYSSKNDTFALPEPKKRLFDDSEDLNLSVSPIKANRRY